MIKLLIGLIIFRGNCFFSCKEGVELLIIDCFEDLFWRGFDGDVVEDCFFWEGDWGMG